MVVNSILPFEDRERLISTVIVHHGIPYDIAGAMLDDDLVRMAETPPPLKRNLFEDVPFCDLQRACKKVMRNSYLP